MRGGVNAKVIYSSYEQYTSWALAVDLGLNYYNADNDLSLSLVARNLGGQIKRYNDTFERMPFDLQIGYTQSLEHAPIRVSVTARNLTRWKLPYPAIESSSYTGGDEIVEKSGFVDNLFRHLIFGVEFLPTDRIYIGVGYNYKTRTDMRTAHRNFLSGFSIGGGIKVRMFGIGVALAQQHTGATTLMVNLSTNLFEFKKYTLMNKPEPRIIIAVDGFSSCGKSTMAKALARNIGYIYIDSGAMYRAVTLYCLDHGLIDGDTVDTDTLRSLMDDIQIDFRPDPETGMTHTFLNGIDVEREIRSMRVSDKVSPVSAIPFVRTAMVAAQQKMGERKGIVMDGRDIGTTVFPHAELKIFVTASAETRAQRRVDELKAKGVDVDFDEVVANINKRDHIDQTRKESPLRKADDAIELDNSHMTIAEQDAWLMTRYRETVEKLR